MGQPTRTIKAVTQQGDKPPVPKRSRVIAVQHQEPEQIGQIAFLATVEKLGYEPKISPITDPELIEACRKWNDAKSALRRLTEE